MDDQQESPATVVQAWDYQDELEVAEQKGQIHAILCWEKHHKDWIWGAKFLKCVFDFNTLILSRKAYLI